MLETPLSFNGQSSKSLRYVTLLASPAFVIYCLLIADGVVPSTNYSGTFPLVVLTIGLAITGIYQFLAPISSKRNMFIRISLYHILAVGTIVFVAGFYEPFAAILAILFQAAYIHFGRKGLLLSGAFITAATVFDILLRYNANHDILIRDILGYLSIMVLGSAVVGVLVTQEIRRTTLASSRAKEELQHNRIFTIINNLSDATISIDKKGIIRLYNAATLILLDTNTSLNGHHIDEILPLSTEDGEKISLFEQLGEIKSVVRRDDLTFTYEDGEEIKLEVTFSPIKSRYSRQKHDDDLEGYIIIVRDITKQKSLEEERDEFISVVSHELRTPITIIEGTISNLQFLIDRGNSDTSTFATSINTAHDQTLYLAKMVNDLSTLSRAERGVADTSEAIDVKELVEKLYTQYQDQATKRKLLFNLHAVGRLGTVSASRLYLEELLQNLITNAIKYTNEGTVTLSAITKDNKVTFSVKDTGIGISKSDQKKIFNKFYRSEDYRTRQTGGTGLGLYVAYKLSKKLGCTIELSSRLNHGSTFSFELRTSKKKEA